MIKAVVRANYCSPKDVGSLLQHINSLIVLAKNITTGTALPKKKFCIYCLLIPGNTVNAVSTQEAVNVRSKLISDN